jgi:DNA polymerase-3 subunit epsilon
MDNLLLIYDTETSGLPLWELPSGDPGQPHIVQLAAMLVNPENRMIIQSMNVIIKPEGWEIPAEVTAVHGLTTEYAKLVGVPEAVALKLFLELWSGRTRIGHVQSFDARIIRIATKRYCEEAVINAWKEGPAQCTASLAKPVMGIKKQPSLSDAYRHFFQKELEDAQSALADTMACMDVFFALGDGKTDIKDTKSTPDFLKE